MATREWTVGDTISATTRQVTRERVIWYEDGLTSAVLDHGGADVANFACAARCERTSAPSQSAAAPAAAAVAP